MPPHRRQRKSPTLKRVQERTRQFRHRSTKPRFYGSNKTQRARNILDINVLRLLGAKLPTYPRTVKDPPSDHNGYFYGMIFAGNKVVRCQSDRDNSDDAKVPELHLGELSDLQRRRPSLFRNVYTDGSFRKSSYSSGYSVFWGPKHELNAFGPVPTEAPLSSAKAEEYALFLALMQIRMLTIQENDPSRMYCIHSDSAWVLDDIRRWYDRWKKPTCIVAWKAPAKSSEEHREILRVAAGLLWDLRRRGVCILLRYVKAHVGIGGNEIADLMAKEGSQSGNTYGPQPVLLKL